MGTILSIRHPSGINSQTYKVIWYKLLNERLDIFFNEDHMRLEYSNLYLQSKYKKELLKSKKYYEMKAKTITQFKIILPNYEVVNLKYLN